MIRDEEFKDIPELGPARDSLDQVGIPTLNPAAPSAPQHQTGSSAETVVRVEKSGGGLMPWLLLLLMIVVGAGGYWGMLHVNLLQQELTQANQRLTDLEGLINATDESANKSGAALQAQIKKFMKDETARTKHVDSELAKLWTVSYQRNKPKIAEIDSSLAALDKQSEQLLKQSDQLVKQMKQALSGLDQTGAELKTLGQSQQSALTGLGDQMRLLDQASQELDALQDSQLMSMEQQLAKIRKNPPVPPALANAVEEHQQAIAAINSFRKQANTQLLRLAARIDALQRAAKAAESAAVVKPAPVKAQ